MKPTLYVFLLAVVVLAGSCQSKPKSSVPPGLQTSSTPGANNVVVPTAPPIELSKEKPDFVARAVTSLGDNTSPRFSADGGKLILLSRGRVSHKQAQVYELDLVRMNERRLTFHDGDDFDPAWTSTGKFVYASGTDELKEDRVALGRLREIYGKAGKAEKVDPTRASEIYLQRLDGREIDRLTTVDGYDGQPTPDPKNWRLVFVSDQKPPRGLHLLDRTSVKRISEEGNKEHSPRFSHDGSWLAWVRDLDDGQSQIFVTEVTPRLSLGKARSITSPGSSNRSPAWSSNSDWILFVSNRSGKIFNVFAANREGSCTVQVTDLDSDVREVDWSPQGDRFAFVTAIGNVNQVYVAELKPEILSCVEPGASKEAR